MYSIPGLNPPPVTGGLYMSSEITMSAGWANEKILKATNIRESKYFTIYEIELLKMDAKYKQFNIPPLPIAKISLVIEVS